MKIGKIIPRPLKNLILRIVRIPERIKVRVYKAASLGKIPFPDKAFQKWDYKIHTGRKLNLRHPVTFQEKLQWMKYYYRNPEFTKLVDKYEVRDYVREKIGEKYLVPLYGVYDRWDEIDFSALPDEFVIKCTHDSGSVVICTDKNSFDFESARKKIEAGLARNQFYLSREWPYKNVKPRIIIEKLLYGEKDRGIVDYKCFSFDGIVKFILVCTNRFKADGMKVSFYDLNWQKLEVSQTDETNETEYIEKPKQFDEMIKTAQILGKGFPHIRVDFIIDADRFYFTELTFFDSGGRKPFIPNYNEYKFGEWITLPPKMR